ncbi:MAG: hypothetical protein J6T16_00550 [Opitutales bacterium]|nr:hypothetical protein [Opitutales bacterium]
MAKFLYVYEFADKADLPLQQKADTLWGYSQEYLQGMDKSVKVKTAGGIFADRRENGLAIRRFLNFLYMHLSAPFSILFSRADIVFVRSTPPMMQITYAFWAAVFRRKKIFWLMDYHPVFGVRTTKKRPLVNLVWRLLDKIDKFFLKRFDLVVCLDEAMRELVKERAPNVETFVCPTFSLQKSQWLDLEKAPAAGEPIKLLYNGNLGRAHSVENLRIFLTELAKLKKIEFSYSGGSKYAIETFKSLCKECGAAFKEFGFVKDYNALGDFYRENGFDYGIVLLNDELKGIVSPSKFSGYTSFGLPIIYLGPRGTNAHFSCEHLGAGVCAENPEQIAEAAKKAAEPETRNACAKNTLKTARHFSPEAAKKLSEKLREFCRK